MPRKASHLQLRGNIYWLRVRVPDALRPVIGKTEIKKSLGTSDVREAQLRARIKRVEIDAEWSTLSRRLNRVVVTELPQREAWQLAASWFVKALAQSEGKAGWENLEDAQVDLGQELLPANLEAHASAEIDRLLADEGIRLEPGSDGLKWLNSYLRRGLVEIAHRKFRASFPSIAIPADPEFGPLLSTSTVQRVAKITVKKVIEDIQRDPARGEMSAKTRLKREAQWQAIKEFFGEDTNIREIGRDQVRRFMELLRRLPSNATKHFPEATIHEAAQLGAEKGLPVLAASTSNDYLRTLGGLFRFALQEGWIAKDPSDGLLIRPEAKVLAKDRRLPFTDHELKAIFSAPLYTGCKDDGEGYAKAGVNVIRRARFWLPLIALFTGMRLNEIAQLSADDFDVQDQADIILIRGSEDDETKRVKTAAGHRFVPVHPELKNIGLLNYVADRRRNAGMSALLFPDLPKGTTGYRSDPFSKFFGRFLDKLEIRDTKKVFHSFRHCYRDALREADISIEKVRALGGWSTGNTEDDYGQGLRPGTLAKAIEAVGYNLDLKHLYIENPLTTLAAESSDSVQRVAKSAS